MRRIVCDTGPLLHLREAAALDLLHATGLVYAPPVVQSELIGLDPAWRSDQPEWLRIQELAPPFLKEAASWHLAGLLDAGEACALALARQVKAEWLLTDDTAARVVAERQGFEVHGSLGIVLWAAATGLRSQEQALASLEALANSSLWVSARVLSEARAALRQICSR